MIVLFQQAAQRRLDLVADDRLRAATDRLGRTAPFVTRRRYPALDRGAANHELVGNRVGWLTGFNRHQHTFT